MPGQQFFLFLSQDVGRALVGRVNVTTYLPIGKTPALVARVRAYFIELGALQQELHHFGGTLLLADLVRHGYLRIPQETPKRRLGGFVEFLGNSVHRSRRGPTWAN